MKVVTVRGPPYERGYSAGQQCAREIRTMLRFLGFGAVRVCMPDFRSGHPKLRYHLITAMQYRRRKQELIALARKYKKLLQEYWPEVIEEIRGIAIGAAVPYEEVLLMNVLGDVYNACSVWAACGEASKEGDPLLGMNSDEEKVASRFEIIKVIEPDSGYKVIGNTMAGWAQLNSGMNERGLAMAFPMLWLRGGERPEVRMPAIALVKSFYECATVDEALAMFERLPSIACPVAQYIIDTGKVARIEWAREEREVSVAPSGILSNTNRPETASLMKYDASLEWSPALTVNAVPRQKRMTQLLERHYGNIDIQIMMEIAADHGEGDTRGRSICQHSSTFMGVATVTSLIANPKERRVWISGCTPCKTGFDELGF